MRVVLLAMCVLCAAVGATAGALGRPAASAAGQSDATGTPTNAAPPLAPGALYHKAWTKQDGAPTASYSMTQDDRGMLWFTSNSGLYQFDGMRFQRVMDIDGNKLMSPSTQAVHAFGNALWVSYSFGGVSVFEHGKVRHYGPADGLPQRSALNFTRTSDGVTWIAHADGLFHQVGERWVRVAPADGLPAGTIEYVTALPDGTLLAYHPDGVYRSLHGTVRFRRLAGLPRIESGLLRSDGKVLLVSAEHQMMLFDPVTEQSTRLPLPAGSATPIDVTLDARDAVMINTELGVQLLGADLRPVRTFGAPHQFSGSLVYNSLIDREGNTWFSTEKGIDYIRQARLNTLGLPARMFGGLSVVAASDGSIWIGNVSLTGNFRNHSLVLDTDGRRRTIDIDNVSATTRAPDGSVWFANSREVWRQQGSQAQRWPLPAAFAGRPVQALAVAADGRLWLSSSPAGVVTMAGGVWQPGGGHAALAGGPAVSLHAEAGGRMWFGYPGNRVAMLDGDALRQFDGRDGIDVGNVLTITSGNGRLWIGGNEGVARWQGQRFLRLKPADGQTLYGVSGLVETAKGELWLQGADGLARICADRLQAPMSPNQPIAIERFDYLDGHEGVPSAIRPLNSLSEAPDGRIWYATTGSVGWVDPARIVRNTLAPAPQVTALKTTGRVYPSNGAPQLPAHTRNLEIDFTAAALSIPERVRFRYRLEGIDTGWRDAGGLRQAFYTNLGPGDYRFEVSAANEDGVWSAAPAALSFHIAPSFTQTVGFKLACAAAVLVVLYLLYLARLAQLTGRIAERHRERALERDRIARTLHDTFLQSVQALILRVDLIKHKLPADSPAHQQIDAALDNAQHVVDEGREQMLDLRVSDVHPVELGEALRAFGAALAAQGGFTCALTVIGTARRLRAAVRAEALAIGKEALTNAARHAACTAVTVEVAYSGKHLRLTVRDDGKGMDDTTVKAGKKPGHWGLEGMRERAHRVGAQFTIESGAGVGTGKGTGTGTSVTFTLGARKAYD